jgi:dipeptidyl aminopeptidase/acylaminoacyl peptidase
VAATLRDEAIRNVRNCAAGGNRMSSARRHSTGRLIGVRCSELEHRRIQVGGDHFHAFGGLGASARHDACSRGDLQDALRRGVADPRGEIPGIPLEYERHEVRLIPFRDRAREGAVAARHPKIVSDRGGTPIIRSTMTLSPGDRIGPYTITSAVGRGGMGEVFRARDTRLNRDVAIKVLPELFADDPDRLLRFQREAQVLAALNHPNIAHVHGLEESGRTRALIMEFVEGRTLADVITSTSGRGLPAADALSIGRQIAEALDIAHEKGIVHRDLKPANVLVTADGTVKVLDFGLAKALDATPQSQTELMNSPTFTGGMTGAGVVLGTAAYMAPEQARGLSVDRRADIWAFGVVLYELLTGRHAFEGDTATDIVAAVITREPDWDRLPPSLPDALVRVMHRCLEKDPKRRMRDIGDARAEIEAASAQYSSPQRPAVAAVMPAHRRGPAWAWGAALALTLVAGAGIGRFLLAPARTASTPVRFEMILPEAARAVMAPDGTRVALTSSKGLMIRDLDRLETRILPGTDGAVSPFWSDDSASLIYGAKGKLWRVGLDGGAPSLLSSLPDAAWDQDAGGLLTADGSIVFTNGSSPLMRVPASGGDATTVVPAGDDELHFHNASGLPESRGILFVVHRKAGADTIDLWTGSERRQLVRMEGSTLDHPVYSPTGHLLFSRSPSNSGLWAVPFSLSNLAITGEPFLVDAGASGATISRTRRLAYVPAPNLPPSRLTWFDREGRQTGRLEDLRVFDPFPAISPDGAVVAVTESTDEGRDIWAVDLETGARRRLTADGFARRPVWAPDGRSLVYVSFAPNARPTLKRVAADGSGLLEDLGPGLDPSFSADGRNVLYWRDFDLFYRPLASGSTEVSFSKGPDREAFPRLSPDGRFVAYVRQDPNTLERVLFVRPFPSGTDPINLKSHVSTFRWSADGRRLIFTYLESVMEVDVQTTPRFRAGVPRKLFSIRPLGTIGLYPGFDVSADGQRFLTVQSEPEASIQRVVVVLDFNPGK